MKKPTLAAALALAIGAGATAPAHAEDAAGYNNTFTCIPSEVLLALLHPVVRTGNWILDATRG